MKMRGGVRARERERGGISTNELSLHQFVVCLIRKLRSGEPLVINQDALSVVGS